MTSSPALPRGLAVRPRIVLTVLGRLVLALIIAGPPLGALAHRRVRLDAGGTLTVFDHPAGGTAWWGRAQTVFFLALAASWLIWLARRAFASVTTWPGWSPAPWNQPTCPYGSANPGELLALVR